MRAVLREFGSLEFRAKVDQRYYPKSPKKGTDEVLVQVYAAGLNPDDYKVSFSFCLFSQSFHNVCICPHFNRGNMIAYPHNYKSGTWPIAGADVAGVIIEVPEDSTSPFKLGDEVFGTCKGSFADRVRVSSARLGQKPKSVNFVQAAAMPTAYMTSLQALRGQLRATILFLVLKKWFCTSYKHHHVSLNRRRQVD